MPWNGSGTWSPVYSWVVEANNGVKILAAHQDTQWGDLASSLGNVWTLDGQTKPVANLSMNGFKLTNAAPASSLTDVATLADIQVNAGEWATERNPIGFVSATQFKVLGIDVTPTYLLQRAVKVIHAGGTSYCNITASSFSTDTLVTVVVSQNITSPIISVSYGTQAPDRWSRPRGTSFGVLSAPATTNTTTGTSYNLGSAPFPITSKVGDDCVEFNNSGTFTALYNGYYLASLSLLLYRNGATLIDAGFLTLWFDAAHSGPNYSVQFGSSSAGGAPDVLTASITALGFLGAGLFLTPSIQVPDFTGGPIQSGKVSFSMVRVR